MGPIPFQAGSPGRQDLFASPGGGLAGIPIWLIGSRRQPNESRTSDPTVLDILSLVVVASPFIWLCIVCGVLCQTIISSAVPSLESVPRPAVSASNKSESGINLHPSEPRRSALVDTAHRRTEMSYSRDNSRPAFLTGHRYSSSGTELPDDPPPQTDSHPRPPPSLQHLLNPVAPAGGPHPARRAPSPTAQARSLTHMASTPALRPGVGPTSHRPPVGPTTLPRMDHDSRPSLRGTPSIGGGVSELTRRQSQLSAASPLTARHPGHSSGRPPGFTTATAADPGIGGPSMTPHGTRAGPHASTSSTIAPASYLPSSYGAARPSLYAPANLYGDSAAAGLHRTRSSGNLAVQRPGRTSLSGLSTSLAGPSSSLAGPSSSAVHGGDEGLRTADHFVWVAVLDEGTAWSITHASLGPQVRTL